MWAQRTIADGIPQRPPQDTLAFEATTAAGLAEQINRQVEKYHVVIVNVSAYHTGDWPGGRGEGGMHCALVTFEAEPIR